MNAPMPPFRFPATAAPMDLAGLGLRTPHIHEVLATRPAMGWFEVHSENYFAPGGSGIRLLEQVRRDYPLSLHGVGLGLGSTAPLDTTHLDRLAALIQRVEPFLVSEHLCWSATPERHLNDLLPLPFTEEAIAHLCARIDAVQTRLGRPLLLENISSYCRFREDAMPEWDFVAAVARRSGCQLVLDINNIYVSSVNHGFDPRHYLAAIPAAAVGEIHLAGHEAAQGCLIDTHSRPVDEAVWALYAETIARIGPRPTLIERDADIPPLADLLAEARHAAHIMEACHVPA